jgi:hypothetical protein
MTRRPSEGWAPRGKSSLPFTRWDHSLRWGDVGTPPSYIP